MVHISIRTADTDRLPLLMPAAVDPLEWALAWSAVLGLALASGLLALVRGPLRAGRRSASRG